METVAAAGGVTRLTVYKQFGSRRGLLEAVFDHRAALGGLSRVPEAMAIDDAREGLDRLAEIFCAFWGGDTAVGRLQAMAASDPEFAETVDSRNERRRQAIQVLLARIGSPERLAQSGNPADHRRDALDLSFTLT